MWGCDFLIKISVCRCNFVAGHNQANATGPAGVTELGQHTLVRRPGHQTALGDVHAENGFSTQNGCQAIPLEVMF